MQNVIYVNGIEVYAYHGVFPEEKRLGQKFIFNISCNLDFRKAMQSDDLQFSVSYGEISQIVADVATKNSYNLLEKLSYEILLTIFTKYSSITTITLEINKPNAPIPNIFSQCGIKVEFSREEFFEVFK